MNDFLKINEMIDLLKVNEKNEINQFKKHLNQQLSNNDYNKESIESLNKISHNTKQSDNKNTDTISNKKSVSEHFETIENNSIEKTIENNSIEKTIENNSIEKTIENNSIEKTEEISEEISEKISEEISEKISEKISEEISNHIIIQKTINTNTQTDFDTNEIQNNEIQNIYTKTDIGFVLFCFDHRFINNMHELLNRDPIIKSFNYFALAGGSLGFLKNELGCWDKTCIDHIELAQKIYNIKKIIIIDHEDCEMYKDYYNDLKKHPKREKKHHINNLTELMEIFEKKFKLHVDAFILNLDGSFIKI
jgi:hypothetical protein